jgi:hypothetical protein
MMVRWVSRMDIWTPNEYAPALAGAYSLHANVQNSAVLGGGAITRRSCRVPSIVVQIGGFAAKDPIGKGRVTDEHGQHDDRPHQNDEERSASGGGVNDA